MFLSEHHRYAKQVSNFDNLIFLPLCQPYIMCQCFCQNITDMPNSCLTLVTLSPFPYVNPINNVSLFLSERHRYAKQVSHLGHIIFLPLRQPCIMCHCFCQNITDMPSRCLTLVILSSFPYVNPINNVSLFLSEHHR